MSRTNVRNFIFKNIGIILTVLISVLYIFKGFYSLEESGKTIYEILGDGALSAVLGFCITALLRQTGINYGNDDIELINTRSLHSKKVDQITPYMNLLDEFCEIESKRLLKEMRTKILAPRGLRYDDLFDTEGLYIGEYVPETKKYTDKTLKKEYKRKIRLDRKAIHYAQGLKLTPLLSSTLTSEGAKIEDPHNFGGDPVQYTKDCNRKQILSKLMCAMAFGYYTLRILDDASWQNLLWPAIQVVLYLVFGAIEMMNAYMFIKTEGNGSMLRKIDMLEKFNAYAKEKIKNVNCSEI